MGQKYWHKKSGPVEKILSIQPWILLLLLFTRPSQKERFWFIFVSTFRIGIWNNMRMSTKMFVQVLAEQILSEFCWQWMEKNRWICPSQIYTNKDVMLTSPYSSVRMWRHICSWTVYSVSREMNQTQTGGSFSNSNAASALAPCSHSSMLIKLNLFTCMHNYSTNSRLLKFSVQRKKKMMNRRLVVS